jgi:hypothetical protein
MSREGKATSFSISTSKTLAPMLKAPEYVSAK